MENRKVLVLPLVLGRQPEALPYLAIGMLSSYIKSYEDGRLLESYNVDPLLPAGHYEDSLKTVYKRVVSTPNPVCLFSAYVWNYKLNLKVAKHIKKISPHSLVIFGGPHVPKYKGETEKFLVENPFIDVAVLGEGEAALAEILTAFADKPRRKRDLTKLVDVTGIVYASHAETCRTADRQRIRDINVLPSPYLTGEFEPWFEDFPQAILETNRGCPYGCTYCDWGSATLAKVTKFTPERVIAEIEYIAHKRSATIFLADANFGMLEQDIQIAKALVDTKAKTGYPRRLDSNFAKNGGRRLMEVIKILHEGGLLPAGIIALQTTDPVVLKAIARDNIKTEAYEKMMTYFNAERIPMASDLMIGLPGQTVDSFANDLQFCIDWKVSANANYTSMMPNAPMAEENYREQHLIVVDDANRIESTRTFSKEDMQYMKDLFTCYQFQIRFGILKYVLYYLQIEHDIRSVDFLRRWLQCTLANDPALPVSTRIRCEIFRSGSYHGDWALLSWRDNANFLFDNPECYYKEIFDFAARDFGIQVNPAEQDTLTMAQQAVLPRMGRQYPYTVHLQHNVIEYFNQVKSVTSVEMLKGRLRTLSQFEPCTLTVTSDAEIITSTAYSTPDNHHNDAWELASPLRFY